ncbi:hypothetical protein ABMA28_010482 [Loxostege sticticalis]|uniref:Core-binding (CB) domain-containing protein n=1 Tax=Loxostege sticticalis TaxID=481309 RepID=A0ABD0SAJ7_LOXSC
MANQCRKIHNRPPTKPCLSGDPLESLAQREESTIRQNNKALPQSVEHDFCRLRMSERLTVPCRTDEFCGICSPNRQATLSGAFGISQFFDQRAGQEEIPLTESSPKGTRMVAPQLSPFLGGSSTATDTFCYDGCLRHSMGGSNRRSGDLRPLDQGGENPALQYEGNAGYSEGLREPRSPTLPFNDSVSVRQSDGGGLLKKRRRDQVSWSNGFDKQNISLARQIPDRSDSKSHSRHLQRSRRSSLQTSLTTRVAPAATQHGCNIPEIWDPNCGSLCIPTSSCSSELRVIRSQRRSSSVPRRVLTNVELSAGVDISPALPDPQGAVTSELSDRDVPTSSASLGSGILEGRHQITSTDSSIHHPQSQAESSGHSNRSASPQSTRYDSRSLEMWGWSRDLTEWNESQLGLLKSSWRLSTTKTYEVAWKRWLQWCKQQKVEPFHPSGSTLARFLADLFLVHKLAYNTILVHKSVVATLCSPDDAGQLSSHTLVKHVLKSISIKKPTVRKPPIWDIDILASFMKTSNVNENNVFAVCRHTSTLLLLCSGRRVHDLTLLAVDSEHLVVCNSSLILWPKFGSKTDSGDHRQSGWRLLSNPDNKNLDPVYWVKQTVRLLDDRRKLAKCTNLFTNIRGQAKEASRTLIAGWIKTLLKEAGITSSPGSLRSAVASKNWANNLPLDEILSRGNWKSANTFANFYRREIATAAVGINNSNMSRLFNPVD